MNKTSILLFALLISVSAFSQEEFRRNEVRLNLNSSMLHDFHWGVVDLYPGISYERILSANFSVGASVGFFASRIINNSNFHYSSQQGFHFTPYFRWFFDRNRKGSGFFIEANGSAFYYSGSGTFEGLVQRWIPSGMPGGGMIPIWEHKTQEFSYAHSDFGLGLGLGWKFLTKNNWVGELMINGVYNFGGETMLEVTGRPNPILDYGRMIYLRLGLSIGRRF